MKSFFLQILKGKDSNRKKSERIFELRIHTLRDSHVRILNLLKCYVGKSSIMFE